MHKINLIMGVYDDDLESEAIAKCAKALSLIENNAKVRVIKHLLDRFELIETNNAISSISNQANVSNLTPTTFAQIESHIPHSQEVVEVDNCEPDVPSIYELMTKGFAKSEMDILLLVFPSKSNKGTQPVERLALIDGYKEYDIHTPTRTKNLSSALNNLLKAEYITALNKTKFSITSKGKEQISLIALGKSVTRTKKKSLSKKK